MKELRDRVAVVTGAGSGIGRALAARFAAEGMHVVLADVDEAHARETEALLAARGGRTLVVQTDVQRAAAVEALAARTLAAFGAVHVLCNNAGIAGVGRPVWEQPLESWEQVLGINLWGVIHGIRTFVPIMLRQGTEGHVVNTSSASGLLAYGFDRLPYVATKHAVVGISEALALYLAPKGVGVTCLCPSGVATNILEQITVYGEATSPRAPQHPIVFPDVVGELVAEAITAGTFLVVTAPEIHDELQQRAADPEAYIQQMIAEQTP